MSRSLIVSPSLRHPAMRIVHSLVLGCAVIVLSGCPKFSCLMCGGTWSGHICVTPIEDKSAVASPGNPLFLSASAHVAGALGTNWRSDVEILGLGDETAVFRILLLEHGADNSSAVERQLTLDPGHSLRLDDVLDSEFGFDGQAALLLVPSAGRVVLASRTYNLLGEGNELGLPAGSTFGQYIPALSFSEAIRYGEQGRLIQLSHSSASDGGFRTNLGLVNAAENEITVEIDLYTADGTSLGSVPVTLEPLGYWQINRVFTHVTANDIDDGYAVVRTTTADGLFFAYASVVDNLTGDPVAISAVRLPEVAPLAPGSPIYVVASAHVAGAEDTDWRSDLEVHCWGDVTASYTIELLEHGADNSAPESRSFTLDPGESVRFEDILEGVFDFEGQAALRITQQNGQVLVTSRTYNLLGEGNQLGLPAGATFGQYIPGVTAEQAIQYGEEGRLIQLSHRPDGESGFRANLVLVNGTASGLDVEIELYASDGTLLGTVPRSLASYEYRQLNRVFELVTGSEVADGYAVLRTATEEGVLFALASVVDNLTGDPVGMGAALVLPAAADELLGDIEGTMDVLGQTTIEDLVERIQSLGVDGVLDDLVAAQSDVASRTADGMVIDYGSGATEPDGRVWSGAATVDTSNVSVSDAGISGTMTISHDDLLVDGEPPLVGPTVWTFDLDQRNDGSVVGSISVEPLGGLKSSGSLSGIINIDTAICVEYPISGCLTLTVDGEVITIILEPHCDGSISRDLSGSGCGGSSEGVIFTLPGGVLLEMVPIPAGTFMMGAPNGEVSAQEGEYPQHQVTLSQDFLMGKYEVTQAQWQAVMGSNPALEFDEGHGDSYPVYNLSWNDIAGPGGFIERLNQHLGTTTFRLPTEAEWEYAARAGTTTRFSHGDALDEPCDEECAFCELHDRHMLWCGNNELVNPDNPNSSEPVGMRTPNAFGLYDVHGNVREWVNDWYVAYSADAQTDPTGPETGSYKIFRNGDHNAPASDCRSAARYAFSPDFTARRNGFRLAKSESP